MPLTNAEKQSRHRARRTARFAQMKEALERIAAYGPAITHGWAHDVRLIARAALEDV